MKKQSLLFMIGTLSCCMQTNTMHRHPKNLHTTHKKAQIHQQAHLYRPTKQENSHQKNMAAFLQKKVIFDSTQERMLVTTVVLLQQLARRNNTLMQNK